MKLFKFGFAFLVMLCVHQACNAQQPLFTGMQPGAPGQMGAAQISPIVMPQYHSPIMPMPLWQTPVSPVTDSFSICDCGPGAGTDCNCKTLNCRIQLPPGCKSSRPTRKDPIPCRVLGQIPKITIASDCRRKIADFAYMTEVPQIHCTTEFCEEIGTKSLQCLPGCCFSVCVPVNKCTTETVECALVEKMMNMEIWERKDPTRGTVYDVYVINDPVTTSAFHAGGMPEKWLLVHCATVDQIKQRLPNSVRADGTPLVRSSKDAKPEKTEADVPVELVIQQAQVEAYVEEAKKKVEADATAAESPASNG